MIKPSASGQAEGMRGMAYRFLLEVPETLAAEASEAVEQTDDAQVILVRDSHGLGFEDPYVDLTVAAHSLRVIDRLYDWFDMVGASQPDIRVVLHGGDRIALEEHDRGAMVGAIRRDQPWVERSIPKVGEHEEDLPTSVGAVRQQAIAAPTLIDGTATAVVSPAARTADRPVPADDERTITVRNLNHLAINVNDLAKAERFYKDFLGMELVGRGRRGQNNEVETIDGDYRWDEAVRTGQQADVSFLSNGPLTLAVRRAGRGARLERGIVDHISIVVDATTFATIKGEALLRPLTVLAATDSAFTFLDPFGMAWELTVQGSVPTRTM